MSALQRLYLFLADAILMLHFAFVVFVVGGLIVIWIGRWRRWNFVRNIWFRVAHLAAIGIVAAESIAGIVCPLTTWEDQLRLLAGRNEIYQGSFIQHWIHRVMFFEVEEWVFTICYIAFFLAVALSFWFVPVKRNRVKKSVF